MKRVFFFATLLVAVSLCGAPFAADITGKYVGYFNNTYDDAFAVIIEHSGAGEYAVDVVVSDGHFSCGFVGRGKLIGNTIQAETVQDGKTYVLPIHIRSGNTLEIMDENNLSWDARTLFCGAGAIELSGTFKKQ